MEAADAPEETPSTETADSEASPPPAGDGDHDPAKAIET
jgi:hypothetical protein